MPTIIESFEVVEVSPVVPVVEPEPPRDLRTGARMGAIGAGILAGIMYAMWSANKGPKPLFVAAQQKQFGEKGAVIDNALGVTRFLAAGAVWGMLFSAVNRRPTALKGALFGLVPSLFLWTVLAKRQGEKPFFGFAPKKIAMPILFNSLIWGSFLGKTAEKRSPQLTTAL